MNREGKGREGEGRKRSVEWEEGGVECGWRVFYSLGLLEDSLVPDLDWDRPLLG